MSEARPRVSPELVATAIDSAPNRVRRRLDRTPEVAAEWNWTFRDSAWQVDTGKETVTLSSAAIRSMEELRCTCLLSPNCFHVLACLTALPILDSSEAALDLPSAAAEENSDDAHPAIDNSAETDTDSVVPVDAQHDAAEELMVAVAGLLQVGVANAGVVVQSSLLRAIHECRASGLHRASACGLRVVTGANEIRKREAEADPERLAFDVADLLETVVRLRRRESVPRYWIGTARRRQQPANPRTLHGLLAEPVLTRSGYAGATVYFLGEDDCVYTVSDVRPGEAQRVQDAYRGGIEMGPLVQPGQQLSRRRYIGGDLTASSDGRLGRGRTVRIAEHGSSSWDEGVIRRRFDRPLHEQWDRVYEAAALPEDVRRAGWDFVFVEGIVVGAQGPQLCLSTVRERATLRLAIANESESFYFRENLRVLSHAPGLGLRVVARLDTQDPSVVYPLAMSAWSPDAVETTTGDEVGSLPRLELPESTEGRINLGLDELERHRVLNAEARPVVVEGIDATVPSDSLAALRRRWIARLLTGHTLGRSPTARLRGEVGELDSRGYTTGAALLDALARSGELAGEVGDSVEIFLAAGVYLNACRREKARLHTAFAVEE